VAREIDAYHPVFIKGESDEAFQQRYIAETAAIIQRAMDGAGWQSIETAPKDGRKILAWEKWPFQNQPRQRIIYWSHEGNCVIPAYLNTWMCDVTTTSQPERYILGWQHLPTPPSDRAPANDNRKESAAA